MPLVTIEGVGQTECAVGRRLVLAIEEAGVDILHRCGGNARCATCRVEVLDGDPGPFTDPEVERLGRFEARTEATRLSCQVQVREDLSVRIARRLRDNPDMKDSGPTPIEWPADHALPPE